MLWQQVDPKTSLQCEIQSSVWILQKLCSLYQAILLLSQLILCLSLYNWVSFTYLQVLLQELLLYYSEIIMDFKCPFQQQQQQNLYDMYNSEGALRPFLPYVEFWVQARLAKYLTCLL